MTAKQFPLLVLVWDLIFLYVLHVCVTILDVSGGYTTSGRRFNLFGLIKNRNVLKLMHLMTPPASHVHHSPMITGDYRRVV